MTLGATNVTTPKTRLTIKRLNVIALIKTHLIWASSRENLSSVVCDKVRPGCSATETSERLETLGLATIGIILPKQQTTKLLIRLCGYTVWSEPLLFTYGINRLSHDVAHLIPNMVTFRRLIPNNTLGGGLRTGGQCYFSAFMICHFSISSFTLPQNSDSL